MLISIILTSYNYQKYLKDTIKSIVSQTYSDWELIIIDDASTDLSPSIAKEFVNNDSRIKLSENKENIGLRKSLQKGITAASGEWIAFLESDDMWTNDYLEQKIHVIEQNPSVSFIFNDVELFGDKNKIDSFKQKIERNRKFLLKQKFPKNMFRDINLQNRILTFSSVMLKKDILYNINWNAPVDKLIDWWIYIQTAYNNDFFYIPEKLTKWQIHPKSYISKKSDKQFCMVNICAYIEVMKQNKTDKSLFLFIFFSTILFALMKINLLKRTNTF